jgi:uncharacterized protein (DUF1810 family)
MNFSQESSLSTATTSTETKKLSKLFSHLLSNKEKDEKTNNIDIEHFCKAHEFMWEQAISELRNGEKESHWIWYIFPNVKGLGMSGNSIQYAIQSIEQGYAYLENDMLRNHLVEGLETIAQFLIKNSKNPRSLQEIMGLKIDAIKIISCCVLFNGLVKRLLTTDEKNSISLRSGKQVSHQMTIKIQRDYERIQTASQTILNIGLAQGYHPCQTTIQWLNNN